MITKPDSTLADSINPYRDMHWAWTSCIVLALALVVWIQIEMLMIGGVSWLHGAYTGLAISMIFIALLPHVRNLYEKH